MPYPRALVIIYLRMRKNFLKIFPSPACVIEFSTTFYHHHGLENYKNIWKLSHRSRKSDKFINNSWVPLYPFDIINKQSFSPSGSFSRWYQMWSILLTFFLLAFFFMRQNVHFYQFSDICREKSHLYTYWPSSATSE